MCLITKQKEAIILTEDLIVYKSFRANLWALYQNFKYERNKLYKTGLTFDKGSHVPCFDVQNANYLCRVYGDDWYDNSLEKLGLIGVIEGFHSARTKHRLSSAHIIYECVIPAGSEVFFDETCLVVSNQIMIL